MVDFFIELAVIVIFAIKVDELSHNCVLHTLLTH